MPRVLCWSTYARDVLRGADAVTVHSAYTRTVNLRVGGELISLQARGTPLSPLSVELDAAPTELAACGATPGVRVVRTGDGLCLGRCRIPFAGAAAWEARLDLTPARAPGELAAEVGALDACLRAMLPTGGFEDLVLPDGHLWRALPAARLAAALLVPCRAAALAGDWAVAARAAAALTGLGEGLTPSGDDFLCGMLAGLGMLRTSPAAAAFAGGLCRALSARFHETNDISAAFLRCACRGLFSRAVLALAGGCGAAETIGNFSAIGHSSGADTLSGILFALRCISGRLAYDWEDL